MPIAVKEVKIPVLFRSLLNRDVTGAKIPAFRPTASDVCVAAVYENNGTGPIAVCVCDLDLVSNAGAALVLVPASVAKESIAAKKLDAGLTENFQEILNICSTLFAGPDTQHITLGKVYQQQADWPPEVAKLISSSKAAQAVKLTISGYGGGRMCVYS